MIYKFIRNNCLVTTSIFILLSCSKKHDDGHGMQSHNPDTADEVTVDRFSATAGHLMVRNATNGLPAPGAPINCDQVPFITRGFGPGGQTVDYYNFDVQLTQPAPIYVFYKNGQNNPVATQLNVIDVIPGEGQYNDFWQVYKVTVPDNYVANSISSAQQLTASGYPIERTTALVNCPVVPKGSTAQLRLNGESNGLVRAWYKDKVAFYFNFSEKSLTATGTGLVPLSTVFVTFNINPGQPNGGPDSGFKTEQGTVKTHNVVATLPADAGYSPLWRVVAYDNNSFGAVNNLTTVLAAPVLVPDAGKVNCPVVNIQ